MEKKLMGQILLQMTEAIRRDHEFDETRVKFDETRVKFDETRVNVNSKTITIAELI